MPSWQWNMKVFGGRKSLFKVLHFHTLMLCVCIMKGFCFMEIGLFFHIRSPRWFELGMLHSCRMLCSDKHGTFSPALLVDASTTLANKTVENLLHLEFLWAGVCWWLTVCQCMDSKLCWFWSTCWYMKASTDWVTDWLWEEESRAHLILPSACSCIEEWGIKEELKDFSLSALSHAFSCYGYLYSLFPNMLSHM